MSQPLSPEGFTRFVEGMFSRLDVGVVALNQAFDIIYWNHFMALASGCCADDVLGKNVFSCFPDVPKTWLTRRVETVFMLGQEAFGSRQHRPHVFPLKSRRTVVGGPPLMVQDCNFTPIRAESQVVGVCISIFDATETAVFEAQLGNALKKVRELSITDALTQLYNRRHVEESLAAEFARSRRYNLAFCVAMVDLDHFKRINDEHGHLGGDEVLREVSRRLRQSARDTDVIGRYGGEEILVLMPGTDGPHGLQGMERLRRTIVDQPVKLAHTSIRVTASVGIAAFDPVYSSYAELLAAADEALYASKANGRDRITLAPPKSSAKA